MFSVTWTPALLTKVKINDVLYCEQGQSYRDTPHPPPSLLILHPQIDRRYSTDHTLTVSLLSYHCKLEINLILLHKIKWS